MIDLILAAALAQAAPAADPCNAVAAGPPAAGCRQWRLTGRDQDRLGFVDPASLHRDGNTFMIDQRIVYDSDTPPLNVRSFIQGLRFDCAGRTITSISITAFDTSGRRVLQQSTGTHTVSPPPNSPGAALMDEFCPR